ncbi:MAG: hypothetical protein ACK4YD_10380 [Chitinophagia bacterium]|jgi:hypothetical protein
MFLTKHDLKLSYGVDLEIGACYVDRKVPEGNLYWKDRTIYVPGAPGYIFMPIFADLLFRVGVNKEALLAETQLLTAERILHSAALLEHKKITWEQHVEQALSNESHPAAQALFADLSQYLSQGPKPKSIVTGLGTKFPSLNRADTYLISLTSLDVDSFDIKLCLDAWYSLMTYFLIMDDLADIKDDLKNNEENAFIDAGLDQKGMSCIMEMIKDSIHVMNKINPVMANRIDHKKSLIDLEAILKSIR